MGKKYMFVSLFCSWNYVGNYIYKLIVYLTLITMKSKFAGEVTFDMLRLLRRFVPGSLCSVGVCVELSDTQTVTLHVSWEQAKLASLTYVSWANSERETSLRHHDLIEN